MATKRRKRYGAEFKVQVAMDAAATGGGAACFQ